MDAIVAYSPDKLPPDIQELLDASRPLPAGTRFFEQKFTYGDVVRQCVWGLILLPSGLLVAALAVLAVFAVDRYSPSYSTTMSFLFTVIVIALVVSAVGFMMLKSLWSLFKIVKAQRGGTATRFGVFVNGDLLIYNNEDATRVVPTSAFKGLKGRDVQFELDGAEKTFALPGALVRDDVQTLDSAVAAWGKGAQPASG